MVVCRYVNRLNPNLLLTLISFFNGDVVVIHLLLAFYSSAAERTSKELIGTEFSQIIEYFLEVLFVTICVGLLF